VLAGDSPKPILWLEDVAPVVNFNLTHSLTKSNFSRPRLSRTAQRTLMQAAPHDNKIRLERHKSSQNLPSLI
jgi:hypothetical protein